MGSHRQAERFMNKNVFRMFKHFLTIISRMTEELPVKYMQHRCIEYLRENNEEAALKWFESTWTGERGTWTRWHSGPGCANTNNAVESGWGRFRAVIPRHYSYPEYMSTMIKHMSDNTKDAHDSMIRDFDSISFPEDPRFTREVWKATCNITIEDLNQWVVFDGPAPTDQSWLDALDRIEEFQKKREVDSLARAGIMWCSENGAPLLDPADVVRVCHPTHEMLELFSPTFNHASPQYEKSVGNTLSHPHSHTPSQY
jgi:hypothetical protein